MSDEGNPYAKVELAQKYLHNENKNTQVQAITYFKDAKTVIGELIKNINDGELKELSASVEESIGKIYYDGLCVDRDLDIAFEYFQNANELDSRHGLMLAECYRNGYGCEPDLVKAKKIEDSYIKESGFMARYELAKKYFRSDVIRSTILFQSAIQLEDSENFPAEKNLCRFFLWKLNAPDENNNVIDQNEVIKYMIADAKNGNSEATYLALLNCLIDYDNYAEVIDSVISKNDAYSQRISDLVSESKNAKLLEMEREAKVAENERLGLEAEERSKREEQETEERAERERLEAEKRAEQEKLEAEKKAKEKKEKNLKIAKKVLPLASVIIVVMIIFIIVLLQLNKPSRLAFNSYYNGDYNEAAEIIENKLSKNSSEMAVFIDDITEEYNGLVDEYNANQDELTYTKIEAIANFDLGTISEHAQAFCDSVTNYYSG